MKTVEEKAMEYTDNEFAILPKSMAKEDMRHRAQKDFEAGYNEAMRCQSSPKIKQLEWIFYGTYYSAETPVTDYLITQEHDFVENDGDCELWVNGFPILHSTLEEAKEAAQAGFEKRVMECLDIADNSNK